MKNNIEVKFHTLAYPEKIAYGYGAEYQAEIKFGTSMAVVVINPALETIQVKCVSSTQPDLYEMIVDWVEGGIMLSDLLLKLR